MCPRGTGNQYNPPSDHCGTRLKGQCHRCHSDAFLFALMMLFFFLFRTFADSLALVMYQKARVEATGTGELLLPFGGFNGAE